MIERLFGGDNFVASTRALDAASLRQSAIANNLANANTPGYKKQAVQFESQLAQAIVRGNDPAGATGSQSISAVQPRLITVNTTSERTDGNNVDMESEMVDLASNNMNFQVLSQSVINYFSNLKAVIAGR